MTQQLFERQGTKRQKNVTVSREVCGVLDRLVDKQGHSAFVEEAVWHYLIDQHGIEEVQAAIEATQDEDIEPHHTLDVGESQDYTIEV